eukprot:7475840-Karenia_brevis.AAC.1
MATLEERVSDLSSTLRATADQMKEWRKGVDPHMISTESRMSAAELNVKWLIHQFEQMSHKDKDGPKGLKKAF